MRMYLNTGFGHPIGAPDLNLIRHLGFDGVRQDLPPGKELELIREFAPGRSMLRPLFLVNGGKMDEDPEPAGGRASRVALMMHDLGVSGEIEIGNEPNIARDRYRDDPSQLALSIRTAWDVMQKDKRIRGTKLVVGGIVNTDKGGQAYLAEVLKGTPPGVAVGFHTYRQWEGPNKPSKGFATRGAEFHALRDIAGGRELVNSEIGFHTHEEKKHFWNKKKGWSDEQVLQMLTDEARYNWQAGVKAMTIFQISDGPHAHYESKFGIRRMDGTLKPSSRIAQVVKSWT